MNKIKHILIALISFIVGVFFLFLSVKVVFTLDFSIFDYDGSLPTRHLRCPNFREFLWSFLLGLAGIVNGLWHVMLLLQNIVLKNVNEGKGGGSEECEE